MGRLRQVTQRHDTARRQMLDPMQEGLFCGALRVLDLSRASMQEAEKELERLGPSMRLLQPPDSDLLDPPST